MENEKEIGGYFELELDHGRQEYHSGAIKLNSGRYCLQYILRTKKYKKIYLPAYICDSVLQPIKNENVSYEFYPINQSLEPIFNKKINDDECFLYVNYFGINSRNVKKSVTKFRNVIVDNSQAFFALPVYNIDTFYSARKFFGVPDGAYLYVNPNIDIPLKRETSLDRMNFLLKRIENTAQEGYLLFQKNESYFNSCGLQRMSKLTERLLSNFEYEKCRKIRNRNFLFLHERLSKYNQLVIDTSTLNGPMVYPFLNPMTNLKETLINNKIYVANYWNEVRKRVTMQSYERYLSENLVPLPIDQRYGRDDMTYIVDIIEHYLNCSK